MRTGGGEGVTGAAEDDEEAAGAALRSRVRLSDIRWRWPRMVRRMSTDARWRVRRDCMRDWTLMP